METIDSAARDEVLFIHRWPAGKPFWLEEMLGEEQFAVTRCSRWRRPLLKGSLHRLELRVQSAALGWKAARHALRRRVLVLAGDFDAGIVCAIVLRLLRQRAPVLCLNMIFVDDPTPRARLRKLLQRLALGNPGTHFTVNNPSLRRDYARLLHVGEERFTVLADCCAPHVEVTAPDERRDAGDYVFVGGDSARDWRTAVAVAAACHPIPFVFVLRQGQWPDLPVPPNVELRFDLPLAEFWATVRGSRLVLVPLLRPVTAGLIVLTRAASMGSLVIATRTAATEQYYPPECRQLLVPMFDAAALAERVTQYWHDTEARLEAAKRQQAYMLERHSARAYAATIASELRHARDAA